MRPGATADEALLALLRRLAELDYGFVTITPASHARLIARRKGEAAASLREALGWSLPFAPGSLDAQVEQALRQAGALQARGDLLQATVRVSSLGGTLFLHSAYPTESEDAVFLGPDSYRFAAAIEAELASRPLEGGQIVDIGAGAGVGGIIAALRSRAAEVLLTDINPGALRLARVNARFAGVPVQAIEAGDLAPAPQAIDLALANPPYLMDSKERAYRDGGDLYGGALAHTMAQEAAPRLAPGGRLLLYTGAAVVNGRIPLLEALRSVAKAHDLRLTCRETDPDVFGEELCGEAYREVERIALLVAVFQRAG